MLFLRGWWLSEILDTVGLRNVVDFPLKKVRTAFSNCDQRMGVFYTGKGDGGVSDLGKKKVPKVSHEMAVLNSLDRLNSLLGLIKHQDLPADYPHILREVQENLFIIQANVAALLYGGEVKAPPFSEDKTKRVETLIDELEEKVQPAKKFIIPGATQGSSWLDIARTFAREAERTALQLPDSQREQLGQPIFSYLNRLSSLLFALARFEVKQQGVAEEHPKYT
ncbi:MAG: cob(I)yrinic acid a,c-diamide adenosyltransferase [Parcubacteria group bacterium]|nr:cob(I)yrinic acid a,c-diamide adenosyltransferase [Parcubacteria group bacterium]